MKLKKVVSKLKVGQTIRNEEIECYLQTPDSLFLWLVDSSKPKKLLDQLLNSDKWVIDTEYSNGLIITPEKNRGK